MVSFTEYQSYKINTELFASSKFQFVEKGNVIDEKTFIELIKLFQNDKEYEIEDGVTGLNKVIKIGQDEHLITAEPYQLDILKTILTFNKSAKSEWIFWSWFFVEGNSQSHTFFVCEDDKILDDCIVLYDIPDNLFEQEHLHPSDNDPDALLGSIAAMPYKMARVRKNYENFYENTSFGKLLIAKSKNELDVKSFGLMQPSADKVITPVFLMPKMESIIKELKELKLILIIGFLLLAAVIYISR